MAISPDHLNLATNAARSLAHRVFLYGREVNFGGEKWPVFAVGASRASQLYRIAQQPRSKITRHPRVRVEGSNFPAPRLRALSWITDDGAGYQQAGQGLKMRKNRAAAMTGARFEVGPIVPRGTGARETDR
jgi:hypothetical protein